MRGRKPYLQTSVDLNWPAVYIIMNEKNEVMYVGNCSNFRDQLFFIKDRSDCPENGLNEGDRIRYGIIKEYETIKVLVDFEADDSKRKESEFLWKSTYLPPLNFYNLLYDEKKQKYCQKQNHGYLNSIPRTYTIDSSFNYEGDIGKIQLYTRGNAPLRIF